MIAYIETDKKNKIIAASTDEMIGLKKIETDIDLFQGPDAFEFYYKDGKVTQKEKDESWRVQKQ